jgi:hypothetical protein
MDYMICKVQMQANCIMQFFSVYIEEHLQASNLFIIH